MLARFPRGSQLEFIFSVWDRRVCFCYARFQCFRFPTVFHLSFLPAVSCWASNSLMVVVLVWGSLDGLVDGHVPFFSLCCLVCIGNVAFRLPPLLLVGCPIVLLVSAISLWFFRYCIQGHIRLGVFTCSYECLVFMAVFRLWYVSCLL